MSELPFRRELLPDGAHVLCAVSGGADSVCLLSRLREEGARIRLSCAHYHHGLRGEEADGDEAFVRSLCEEWGIPFYCERGDVRSYAKRRALSLETAARELRYEFLTRCAEQCGATLIATAHTADDNAETMLLRLARGSGLAGLGGIAERRDNIVRPLLSATREQVERYLAERGLTHREDSTNALDDAARNRVRHHAMDALRSVNPAFALAALRTAELCREDEAYLSSLAETAFGEVYRDGALSVSGVCALPEPIARRVLRMAAGERTESVHVAALLALCRSRDPSGECFFPGGHAVREYELLRFDALTPEPLEDRELPIPGTLRLPEAGLALRCTVSEHFEEIQSSFNTFAFSYGKICGSLLVTARREGDRLTLRGRNGTHSVKKLFTDAKIPRRERDRIPILRDESGPLAVYGFGQTGRVLPERGERAVIVSFINNSEEQRE